MVSMVGAVDGDDVLVVVGSVDGLFCCCSCGWAVSGGEIWLMVASELENPINGGAGKGTAAAVVVGGGNALGLVF